MTETIDTGRCFICGSTEPPAMHAVMGHLPPHQRPHITRRPAWLERQQQNGARDLTGQIKGDR